MAELAKVTCPAPGCDFGDDGGPRVLYGGTMKEALRERDRHLRHIHPGYKPPTGSMASRVPRLD